MLLSIDGTIIFVFLSFLVFVFLMNVICYKPVMKVIEEREKFYEKNKKTVQDTNIKKEEVIKTIEKEISNTKLESSKMLKNAMDSNKEEKEEAISNKKAQILNDLNDYENKLDNNSYEIKNQLKTELEGYVKSTVSKVLNVNPDEIIVDNSKIEEILK